MNRSKEAIADISRSQYIARRGAKEVLTRILKQEVIHEEGNGLAQAVEAAKNGKGLVIVWAPHWSFDDGFRIATLITNTAGLRNKRLVYPLAKHQDSPPLQKLGASTGIDYPVVVTEDTIQKKGFEKERVGEGVLEYMKKAYEAMKHGGISVVAIQGKREAYFDPNNELQPVKGLIRGMKIGDRDSKRKGEKTLDSNYGVLLVGLGEKGRLHYDSPGFHPFTKGTVTIGQYYTIDQLIQKADGLEHVDEFLREQFMKLMPKEYLYPPTAETRAAQRKLDIKRVACAVGLVTMAAGIAYALNRHEKAA
ncbi:hypothetical protein BH11PAT1_BH11PAT1_2080 [soil metagenome]